MRLLPATKTVYLIKSLIWLYFWLLISEGALRKWILPELANPLLIVRDPVVISIYFFAILARIFPWNRYVLFILILTIVSFWTSMVLGHQNLPVTFFGLRSNFLHLPLIFLIPKVFNLNDVNKIGKWILILAIPMALLMIRQFQASPNSIIVQGVRGEFVQIGAALGKIRPPGTFSFITGPVSYYALVAVFLIYGAMKKKTYNIWLLFAAGIGLIAALSVSGSRSFVASILVVLLALLLTTFMKTSLLPRVLKLILLTGIIILALSTASFFQEGTEVLQTRFDAAQKSEAESGGMTARFLRGFTSPIKVFNETPFWGYGIGMGTNAGSVLLTGASKRQFLLAEREWERVMLESGKLLGPLFILFRIVLAFYIFRQCIRSVRSGNILPMLVLGAIGLGILIGSFGQPTALGFAVFGGGLCLAACRVASVNGGRLAVSGKKREIN